MFWRKLKRLPDEMWLYWQQIDDSQYIDKVRFIIFCSNTLVWIPKCENFIKNIVVQVFKEIFLDINTIH